MRSRWNVYNLLLNACQPERAIGTAAEVVAALEAKDGSILLNVLDNGTGVSEGIRKRSSTHFVSEGKHVAASAADPQIEAE
jgi:nitrogen fixation/metabolism regulation signal transduction histidine kinase